MFKKNGMNKQFFNLEFMNEKSLSYVKISLRMGANDLTLYNFYAFQLIQNP